MKNINEFLISKALASAWRQYHYMNHLNINNAIIHCENIEQSVLFWKAFKHFFKTNVEPKEFIFAADEKWENKNSYWDSTKDYKYDLFKSYTKHFPDKTYNIAYSIIDKEDSAVTNYGRTKGIFPEVKKQIIKNLNGIDLGDSRNFISAKVLIEKIELLAASKIYMGSPCSWGRIAPYFNTSCVFLADHY